ncbi:adenylate/guanylate cyclase domain-containing protein [Cryomorphaceae bacterium]|nr:adenylate/guanylate cyclase domain-containing protein [Cryomorphaceae bacterium]
MNRLFFALFFLLSGVLNAQPILKSSELEDSGREIPLDDYLVVWKDTTGERDVRWVWLRERTSFKPLTDFNFERPLVGTYWMFLKYEPSEGVEPYITFNGSKAHLYYRGSTSRILEYTGPSSVRLQSRRKGATTGDVQVFQLKGLPDKAQFLLFSVTYDAESGYNEIGGRYSSRSYEMIDLIAGQQNSFYAFFGILVTFLLYNFFFLLVTRSSSNAYFLIYVLAATVLCINFFQTDVLFATVEESHSLGSILNRLLTLTLLVSFGAFTMNYMNLRERHPRIRQVILGLLSIFVINFVLWLFNPDYEETTRNINVLLALVMFFCAVLAALKIYLNGVKHMRFVMLSFIVMFVFLILFGLDFFDIVPTDFNFFFTGITSQIFLFSLSFADRFNLERAKRLDVLSQQKSILEMRVRERTREIKEEQEKSEALLLNILPAETAEELKVEGRARAHLYPETTVLFSDFVGFTKLAEELEPQRLVDLIDHCFRGFDEIIDDYPIEKIKTIGDAYMCVCGLPHGEEKHAQIMVEVSLKMREFMMRLRRDNQARQEPYFDVRIGLSSGPVVAGVVGTKKFQYDIWGDTVNTAARMEQHSEPDKINISQSTYELVKNVETLYFEPRGSLQVKNKGSMHMYYIERSEQE